MNKRSVTIHAPCNAPWSRMIGDRKQRFCVPCSLDVRNLSAMTRREAERVIASSGSSGRVCVRASLDARGNVEFQPRRVRATAPQPQLRGAAQLVATVSAVAALFMGCDAGAPGPEPHAPAAAATEDGSGAGVVEASGDSATATGLLAPDPASAAVIEQEQQAAERLEALGVTLEEEEIVEPATFVRFGSVDSMEVTGSAGLYIQGELE